MVPITRVQIEKFFMSPFSLGFLGEIFSSHPLVAIDP
jgi:hypothetical protein